MRPPETPPDSTCFAVNEVQAAKEKSKQTQKFSRSHCPTRPNIPPDAMRDGRGDSARSDMAKRNSPAAVEKASGRRPELPDGFAHLLHKDEDFTIVPNDRAAVEEFMLARARAVHEKV